MTEAFPLYPLFSSVPRNFPAREASYRASYCLLKCMKEGRREERRPYRFDALTQANGIEGHRASESFFQFIEGGSDAELGSAGG
jgi:hypothetical protein